MVQWYKNGHWRNIQNKNQKQRQWIRCAEQSRLRWRWRLGNRHLGSPPPPPPNKNIHLHCIAKTLYFLWWILEIQTRRKEDTMYRMPSVGPRRVLRCWISHVCLWILQININFEHFLWYFSRCPFLYPNLFLYQFWCIMKNRKKKTNLH